MISVVFVCLAAGRISVGVRDLSIVKRSRWKAVSPTVSENMRIPRYPSSTKMGLSSACTELADRRADPLLLHPVPLHTILLFSLLPTSEPDLNPIRPFLKM